MDLTVDPLVEQLRRVISAGLTPVTDDDPERLWPVLVDYEVPAFEAPPSAGGYGLGLTSGVVVSSELGRRALPDLYTGTALVVDAMSSSGDRTGMAASLVGGKGPVVLAGMDALPGSGRRDRPTGKPVAGGIELAGEVLVDGSAPAFAGCCFPVATTDSVLLVLLTPEAFSPVIADGPPGLSRVRLDGMVVSDDEIAGSLGTGDPLSDPDGILSRARLRQAAYLLGLAAGAQSLAAAHASTRRQFGRPVVEFQTVGFTLARSAIALRAVYLAIERAAWLADDGALDPLAAVEALAFSAETGMTVIRAATQIHGAVGLTRLSAMHRYYLAARRHTTGWASPSRLWCEAGARRLASGRSATTH
ncbi:acyl-CoA dehydrogenase family protein [Amycolatopsis sp. cmx-11-12]|uniref:acyl-CoA dehydrogenase family protein n=1 Tax=Amycolatopsis sp. cmx-11-12 TaxID=2785795 RepID=UPI003917026B